MTGKFKVEARMAEVEATIAGLDKALAALLSLTSSTDYVDATKRVAKKMDRVKDRIQAMKSALDHL